MISYNPLWKTLIDKGMKKEDIYASIIPGMEKKLHIENMVKS